MPMLSLTFEVSFQSPCPLRQQELPTSKQYTQWLMPGHGVMKRQLWESQLACCCCLTRCLLPLSVPRCSSSRAFILLKLEVGRPKASPRARNPTMNRKVCMTCRVALPGSQVLVLATGLPSLGPPAMPSHTPCTAPFAEASLVMQAGREGDAQLLRGRLHRPA